MVTLAGQVKPGMVSAAALFRAGDRDVVAHLPDQQGLGGLMVLQAGDDIQIPLGVEDADRIAGLGAGSCARFLGRATITALQIAPHVDDFAVESDALTSRLREACSATAVSSPVIGIAWPLASGVGSRYASSAIDASGATRVQVVYQPALTSPCSTEGDRSLS